MYVDIKLVAAITLTGALTWILAQPSQATAAPPSEPVCLKIAFMNMKPANRVQEFMQEQQAAGYERFVSLPMGDGAGLMCAW